VRHASWWLAVLVLAYPCRLAAQGARHDFLAAGVQAYRRLDLDAAVGLLERAVADSGATALSVMQRASALSYLAAANLLAGHRERATAAFRELVELDPRLRPDSLVFPPGVLAFYEETRSTTPALAVNVRGSEIGGPGGWPLIVRLAVTTSEAVEVTIRRPTGAVFASLYSGSLNDSVDVTWNGRDTAGQLPVSGPLWLHVVGSATMPEPFRRVIDVPLDVRVMAPDSVAWPVLPVESLLPERAPGRTDWRPVVTAGVLGVAVVALPRFIAGSVDPTRARFVVVAALGVAGITGMILARRPQSFPVNFRANAGRVEVWKRAAADASAENRRRRDRATIVVRAGPPTIRDSL
jgi:hypothetical protein